jgi:hypothetical protein
MALTGSRSPVSRKRTFPRQSIVAGNWSTSNNGRCCVLYFVPVSGYGHCQIFHNDKFLDVFVTFPTTVRVSYEQYNVTAEVANPNERHPDAFVQVAHSKFVDVCLLSRAALEITLIDVAAHTVESWSFIRPHLTNTDRDGHCILRQKSDGLLGGEEMMVGLHPTATIPQRERFKGSV